MESLPIGVERDNIISFEIMIEVIDSPPELRPGMSTDVDIITYEEKAVLLIPIEAIQGETTVTAEAQVGASAGNFKSKQSVQLKSITGKTFNGTITSVQGSQLSNIFLYPLSVTSLRVSSLCISFFPCLRM